MDSEKLNKVLSWTVAGFALLAGIYTFSFLIIELLQTHSPVLKGDQWSEAGRVKSFTDLFSTHNEHRIVFARLVFSIDNMFGGTQIINKAANLLLMASMIFALLRLVKMSGVTFASPHGITLLGVAVATGYSLAQSENFEWGFQVQFFAVYAFAAFTLLSAASGLKNAPKDGLPTLVALLPAFGFYLLTAASMANGVLLGLVLSVYVFLADAKFRWRAGLFILAASLAFIVVYFALWEGAPSGGGNGGRPEFWDIVKENPILLPQYIMGVIGALFTWTYAWPAGTVMTIIAIAAFFWTTKTRLQTVPLALLALFGFCLLTAMVIAYGRLPFGVQFAASSRYATISVLALLSLIGWLYATLGFSFRKSAKLDFVTLSASCSVVIISLFFAFTQNRHTAYLNVMWQGRLNMEAALINKSVHSAATARMGAPPNLIGMKLPYLIENRLSLFAERSIAPIGEPISELGSEQNTIVCRGVFDAIEPEYRENSLSGKVAPKAKAFLNESGIVYRAHGWTLIDNRAPKRVFLTDQNDIITAEAVIGFPRPDLRKANVQFKGPSPGWIAYFYLAPEFTGELSAWAVGENDMMCKVGSVNVAPSASARPTNTRIPARGVKADIRRISGWEPRAAHPSAKNAPEDLNWWGSWINGDGNTGSIVFRDIIIPEDQSTIYVVMMTGPSTGGQYIKLIETQTGDEKIISGFPDLPDWTSLKIELPSGWRRIDVKIADEGSGWGQWSATAGVWLQTKKELDGHE